MAKLILIEGIPGSGKTTTAKRLSDFYKSKGYQVAQYNEGDLHPADLSWQAILTDEEYKALIKSNKAIAHKIKENSVIEDGRVIIAYTALGIDHNSDLYKYLESKEIYNTDPDIHEFKLAHLNRWSSFVKHSDPETLYIFECVLLQNHLTQLMLEYQVSEELFESYFKDFIDIIKPMDAQIYYLSPISVEQAIRHVARERRPEHQDRQSTWINNVIAYIKNTPFGKATNFDTIEDFIDFTSKRQRIEKKLLKNLDIAHQVIEHEGKDWDRVLKQIIEF